MIAGAGWPMAVRAPGDTLQPAHPLSTTMIRFALILAVDADRASGARVRPPGPSRRARPRAGEHAPRVPARAGSRRGHDRVRHGDHQGRRGRDPPRPLAQSGHHARPRRPVAGRARPGDPRADLRGSCSNTTSAGSSPAPTTRSRFRTSRPVDGTRIPRLADLFDLVKKSGNATVGFDCETKVSPHEPAATLPPEEFARKAIAEIRNAGMETAHHGPVVRLAHAAGDPEGGAGDPDDVPLDAANARTRRPRQAVAVARGLRARAATGPSVPKAVHAAGGRIWAPNHELPHARQCWPRRARWASR